ncbi:HTH-type transcriptional activator RhaS [Bacteroides pyogenes]|uniref:AraC-type transcription regulator n=2 Tax=Bacteroides pyogenes TaxID=310300 RepID=W4PKU5_9BACE|nr:helix-turn-helix domain-containing protein [Bacteroides pyogenes]GAE16276.1 AraC-type transcription regulator [Bacteroides pyogenes JCM 6292]MBR8708765.1 HTH-type transcriptional activator RhaS [Bacteroides pyogenes]MBR8717526.1 HTH-type transcriptional activator RhaS [Bacteroides pyogenes]MBR8720588.1 HTH-type transcriptional activator RhaS [Bacteroides pyogenes]MBR8725462.1 HTH-type transcriptional activator RhaS [Bacteroides pyogenes]
MNVQSVPKIGISSVFHSKRVDPANIEFVDNDMALFDTESILSLFDGPSKLEVLSIGLCLEGRTILNLNLREYELVPGRMVVILPNQIMEYRRESDGFRGIFLAVSMNMLELLPQIRNMLSLFLYLKDYPCLDLTIEEQMLVKEYYAFIRKRLKDKQNAYRRDLAFGLMQSFFFELYSIFHDHTPVVSRSPKNKSRKEYIFERFYESLVHFYQSERSVKFYADQLCLTPKHLSGVVKSVSGKTVGEWIDEFVILEAKALLNSSNLNIQEIADQLNFANQSFFGKYFKHYTGMSPKEYRKSR